MAGSTAVSVLMDADGADQKRKLVVHSKKKREEAERDREKESGLGIPNEDVVHLHAFVTVKIRGKKKPRSSRRDTL